MVLESFGALVSWSDLLNQVKPINLLRLVCYYFLVCLFCRCREVLHVVYIFLNPSYRLYLVASYCYRLVFFSPAICGPLELACCDLFFGL